MAFSAQGGEAPAYSGRLLAGDGLRALAALGVVLFHTAAGVLLLRTGGVDWGGAYGAGLGAVLRSLEGLIYLFFALSGYLLARPWIAALAAGGPLPALGTYTRRRVLRIVPPFWAACAALLLLYGTRGSSPKEVASLFAFAQVLNPGRVGMPIAHGWSVDAEMAFYLVLPAAAWATWRLTRHAGPGGRRVAAGVGVVAAAAGLGYLGRRAGMDASPVVQSPLGVLRAFVPGVALAAADVRWGTRLAGRSWAPGLAAGLGVLGVACLLAVPQLTQPLTQLSLTLGSLAGSALVAGPLVLQRGTGRAWRALVARPVRWLGERSYSVFLLHGIAIYELRRVAVHAGAGAPGGLLALLATSLPVTLALAWASHRWIEVPALRLGHPSAPRTAIR